MRDKPQHIKAVSLWQPWAILCALSEKVYETRHWQVPYHGPLLIHAAKRWTWEEKYWCRQEPFQSVLKKHGYNLDNMPLGCALAVVDLVQIYRVEAITHQLSIQELSFGNYQPGRFAWKFENVRRLSSPLPLRGQQGIWDVEMELIRPYLEITV